MANLIPENIRKLLSDSTFKMDADSINESLICTLCGKLMVDAYQTHCDCNYCRECVIRHLDDGNSFCRGGRIECQEEQLVFDCNVYHNIALNKKILKARIVCPNQSCGFVSPLTEMEDHLRLCSQQPIKCPYKAIGCVVGEVPKEKVEIHLHKESLVHSELLMEVICNLRNEIGGLKEDCRMNKVEIAGLREESRLKDGEIVERVGAMDELVDIIRGHERQVDDLHGKVESLEGDDSDTCTGGEVTSVKREAELSDSSSESMEDVIGGAESASTAADADGRRADAVTVTGAIDGADIGADSEGAVGELWFSVDGVAARLEKAEACIESPHLYSHANGYKLRVRVDIGGLYDQYLYAHTVVCRGEYDEALPWPCVLTVSVAIVNRHTRQPHATRVFQYDGDTDERHCGKPSGATNTPYGGHQIASHSDIRYSGIAADDSLLFHVTVAR